MKFLLRITMMLFLVLVSHSAFAGKKCDARWQAANNWANSHTDGWCRGNCLTGINCYAAARLVSTDNIPNFKEDSFDGKEKTAGKKPDLKFIKVQTKAETEGPDTGGAARTSCDAGQQAQADTQCGGPATSCRCGWLRCVFNCPEAANSNRAVRGGVRGTSNDGSKDPSGTKVSY